MSRTTSASTVSATRSAPTRTHRDATPTTTQCAPCETNEDCDGVDGLAESGNACDADKVCVECTPETEAETCPNDKSCNPRTKTCTETTVGSRGVCETCVADSECGDRGRAGGRYKCVPMYYPNVETPLPRMTETGFCLKSIDRMVVASEPYAIRCPIADSAVRTEPNDDYCGINEALTTCPAVRALVADASCNPANDWTRIARSRVASVGEWATCRIAAPISAATSSNARALPVPGSTCGSSGSGGDKYCGG